MFYRMNENNVKQLRLLQRGWKVAFIVSYYTLFRRIVLVNLELLIVYDKRPTSFRRSLSLWFCLGVCKEARAWRMLVVVFFFIKVVWDKFHISFQPFSFWIPQQSFITNSLFQVFRALFIKKEKLLKLLSHTA